MDRKGEGMGPFIDAHQMLIECQAVLLPEKATLNKSAIVSTLLGERLEVL